MHGPSGFGVGLVVGVLFVVACPVGGPVNGAASLPEKSAHPASSAAAVATTTARRAPERARRVPSLMPPPYRSAPGRGSLPARGAFAL
ncbi:hypothetical protein [Tsukamurella paurometabola]|uniref:Secreted protein n=1 Tax=Tsukamurella paurometabola TaxID=2061 RepID=A0ABS5NKJ2_TSUPA|nr:hypothetical protein [Tsukamurella paurometabola]MBS4104137.1 hypothetical protein [Tsukamurella paurometabola]